MNDTITVTDMEVLKMAEERLAGAIPLQCEGYRCQSTDIYQVLLGVIAQGSTIEAVCREWVNAPVGNTVRNYLHQEMTVEALPQLEKGINKALVAQLPQRLRRRSLEVAIDTHDRPYYGRQEQESGLWVRSRADRGTTRFYRIATSYVIVKGLRLTLGVCFVTPDDRPVDVVRKLCQQLSGLKLKLRYLLLDKGFCGVEVQQYLTAQQIPAIIACTIRGRKGGTRALCQGRSSYLTDYTFNPRGPLTHTAQIAVCRVMTSAKRTKRLQRRAMWQLFILIQVQMKPQQVRRLYRRRFGIETSYRCAQQLRGWTTSANPVLRFLLMALPFVLLNLWLGLRWLLTQLPRRGGRRLQTTRFTLQRLARFIRQALDAHYGVIHEFTALSIPIH